MNNPDSTTPHPAPSAPPGRIVPVLEERGELMHWVAAAYRPDVTLRAGSATVSHTITAAPQLEALTAAGSALWATELRCPRTLYSQVHTSSSAIQQIRVDTDETGDDAYLVPGLVAARRVDLDASGLDPFAWYTAQPVDVPQGWWLARGEARRVRPLAAALVCFARDNHDRLKPGQMRAAEATGDAGPFFRVTLCPGHPRDYPFKPGHPDRRAHRRLRSVACKHLRRRRDQQRQRHSRPAARSAP